jgi:hypothetical protein
MQPITNFLKGVFNFFVGDIVILLGVALTLLLVALIENLGFLSGLKEIGGYLFFAGIVLTLFITLRRETHA